MTNAFGTKWLRAIALLHVVGGVALGFDFPAFIWESYRTDLYLVFNIQPEISEEIKALNEMIIRLFGATVASWGAMMWILVGVIESHGLAIYRPGLIVAFLIWFTLDCAIFFELWRLSSPVD